MNGLFPNAEPLKNHEKLTVLLFVAFLFTLFQYALKAPPERWPGAAAVGTSAKQQVVVELSGEGVQPGRYHFKKGMTLRQALHELALLEDLEVIRCHLDAPLKAGQKIRIKKRKRKP